MAHKWNKTQGKKPNNSANLGAAVTCMECDSCRTLYNVLGGRGSYCIRHAKPGMTDVVSGRCTLL